MQAESTSRIFPPAGKYSGARRNLGPIWALGWGNATFMRAQLWPFFVALAENWMEAGVRPRTSSNCGKYKKQLRQTEVLRAARTEAAGVDGEGCGGSSNNNYIINHCHHSPSSFRAPGGTGPLQEHTESLTERGPINANGVKGACPSCRTHSVCARPRVDAWRLRFMITPAWMTVDRLTDTDY